MCLRTLRRGAPETASSVGVALDVRVRVPSSSVPVQVRQAARAREVRVPTMEADMSDRAEHPLTEQELADLLRDAD